MKSSSGRARYAATLAATAFAGFAFALGSTTVHAQTRAVTDGTPQIDAAIAQKDWAGALKDLDARIASNPRDAQARFKRATVLARLNRDDEAITAFTELTQMYPELPEPYNNLAALYAKHGRYDESRVALETAVKTNPSYVLAYENIGDLYLRLADASYRRAQSLGRASAVTQQRLADLQKIVSPPATPRRAKKTPVEDYTNRASSDLTNNPAFTFGGPTGSLAVPPYMAPSQ
jgi:Flp pilus assembly protein TadD